MGWGMRWWSKTIVDHQQWVKYMSTTIKTLWPAHTATSWKDRWIGAYSIGLTILGKLGCPNNNNYKKKNPVLPISFWCLKIYLCFPENFLRQLKPKVNKLKPNINKFFAITSETLSLRLKYFWPTLKIRLRMRFLNCVFAI